MTSQLEHRSHPVVEFAHALTERLEKLARMPAWSMTPEEHREVLRELARGRGTARGSEAAGAGGGREIGCRFRAGCGFGGGLGGDRDQPDPDLRAVGPQARPGARAATPCSRAALDAGCANVAQARAIVTALDRLPTSGEFAVDADQRQAAEAAPGRPRRALRRQGAGGAGSQAVRGDRPGPGRCLRGPRCSPTRKPPQPGGVTFTMREDDAGTCHGTVPDPELARPGAAQDAAWP